MTNKVFQKLRQKNNQLGNQVCVGIDPDVYALDGYLKQEFSKLGARDFLEKYSTALIESAATRVSSVKLQSAFFESHGAAGMEALARVIKHAKSRDLLTILDAKRCDIASTMQAYGRAAFDHLDADFLTVILYMGISTLDALRLWLDQGRGVYIVLLSSNPDGTQLQNLRLEKQGGKPTVARALLEQIYAWADKYGYRENLGLVIGATTANGLDDDTLNDLATTPLLMPGIGAQGALLNDQLRKVYRRDRATILPISRGLTATESSLTLPVKALSNWPDFHARLDERISAATQQLS